MRSTRLKACAVMSTGVARRGVGKRGLQRVLGRLAQRRHVESEADRRVRHLHADAARDGDERDARTLGEHAEACSVGDVEHLVRVARPVGAELPERRLVDPVRPGERRRVRPGPPARPPRSPRPSGTPPACGGRGPSRGPCTSASRSVMPSAWAMMTDTSSCSASQPSTSGTETSRLVACRHPVADVDVALAGQQRQVAAVSPALADQRHAARCGKAVLQRRAERGEEADLRVVDAEAVGTDDAQAGLCRDLTQPLLQSATLGAHLGEAGAVDDRDLHAARRARFDGFHHARGRLPATIARSTASGTSEMCGNAASPWTSGAWD